MATRRRPVVAEFQDRFGEKQIIHRDKGGKLKIRRNDQTVVLSLARSVGTAIGQRVKEERLKAGWPMELLASRAGLKGGKQAIYKIECAMDVGVRIGTLYAIAAALAIEPSSLLPSRSDALRNASVTVGQSSGLVVEVVQ